MNENSRISYETIPFNNILLTCQLTAYLDQINDMSLKTILKLKDKKPYL